MSLTSQEQFNKILEDGKEALILITENPTCDAIGSAWALYFFLERKGIKPTIGFSGELPAKLDFLPQPERLVPEISGAREFVLSFNTERNKIISLRQESLENRFNVYLTPERGSLDPRDFSFILAKFKFDLVIVINSPDLEKLGKTYTNNSDLFFEVPIVNIDNRSDNDNFGQINLVDITASSCSEIVKTLLGNDFAALDKNIATCLLLGIIGATNNFQKKNTTPKALLYAAELMDLGADQQKIIRWLYKTQPLNILKLLGRVMSKMNWEEKHKLAWVGLDLEDFVQSRTNPDNLPIILEKLQENYTEGKIFLIAFNDRPLNTTIHLRADRPETLQKLAIGFGAKPSAETLKIELPENDLQKALRIIITRIEQLFPD